MNETDTNAILAQWDGYICRLARQSVPRSAHTPAITEMDIEDLAQQVRIKLWIALEEREITNHKAYIRSIVHNEVVNMIRRDKGVLPLFLDEEGELSHNQILTSLSEELQDPACVIEQAENMNDCLEKTAHALHTLPPRQRHAMLCMLKDQVDDLLLLITVFKEKHLEIKDVQWPEEKVLSGRLRASLWVSRKKLREILMPAYQSS